MKLLLSSIHILSGAEAVGNIGADQDQGTEMDTSAYTLPTAGVDRIAKVTYAQNGRQITRLVARLAVLRWSVLAAFVVTSSKPAALSYSAVYIS